MIMKIKPQVGRKIFENYISNKGLVSRAYEILIKYKIKNTILKIGKRFANILLKKIWAA